MRGRRSKSRRLVSLCIAYDRMLKWEKECGGGMKKKEEEIKTATPSGSGRGRGTKRGWYRRMEGQKIQDVEFGQTCWSALRQPPTANVGTLAY